ncbi:hypothetical protein EBB07_15350 [Paenibacillaceae bacterium]|nr:hypothetical protein EBB07_15350 [Paenibacillaceae bacterium]
MQKKCSFPPSGGGLHFVYQLNHSFHITGREEKIYEIITKGSDEIIIAADHSTLSRLTQLVPVAYPDLVRPAFK